jgi:hypothetical protein
MPQFARPSADVTDGNWTNNAGNNVDLYSYIDETSANDTDYIQSETAPANSPCVVKLSAVEDPQSSTGHIIRFRYQKNSAGGAQINLTVQLREGYVNESSQGTLIASTTVTDIPNGWVTGSYTLTGAEADAITNYADLYLRFIANQV